MKKAFLIIFSFNILRFVLISIIDILPNETILLTQYLNNSETTSAPSIIQLITGGAIFLFGTKLMALRLVFFLISLLSQWSLFLLINKIIRSDRQYYSWAIIVTTLAFTFISINTLTDTILVLFWILSLLVLYNAIFENDKTSWLLSGIFMGFAILNKLTGLALPIGFIIFLIFSSRYRKHFLTLYPYIALLITGLLTSPIWSGIINTQNASMQLDQIVAIANYFQVSTNHYTSFISFQVVLLFPVLYIGLWWVTLKYFGRIFNKPNQVNPEFWFLLSFFLPLFFGFHLISFFSWVDFLGLIPVYIPGLIVLLKLIKSRWIYWAIGFSVLGHILLLLGIYLWG